MNKDAFNNLKVIDQINYINNKLSEGNTLTKIAKEIGIGRSTMSERFKKVGYTYNGEVKQYQCYIEIVDQESSNNVVGTANTSEDINIQASSNDVVGAVDIPEDFNVQASSNFVVGADSQYRYEDLIKIIDNYNSLNNKMNEMYSWYKLQNSNDVVEENKFTIMEFKGDTVARSFKLYDSVQKEFLKFCKKNNKYKVQDVLSTLLYEAMKKYK